MVMAELLPVRGVVGALSLFPVHVSDVVCVLLLKLVEPHHFREDTLQVSTRIGVVGCSDRGRAGRRHSHLPSSFICTNRRINGAVGGSGPSSERIEKGKAARHLAMAKHERDISPARTP